MLPHGGGGLGYVFQLFCSSLPELRHGLGQATTVVVPVSVKQERERAESRKIEVDDTVECILHSVLSEILRSSS